MKSRKGKNPKYGVKKSKTSKGAAALLNKLLDNNRGNGRGTDRRMPKGGANMGSDGKGGRKRLKSTKQL